MKTIYETIQQLEAEERVSAEALVEPVEETIKRMEAEEAVTICPSPDWRRIWDTAKKDFDTSSFERQRWLEAATEALREKFVKTGYEIPTNVRVSIGWPAGSRGKVGQCWYPVASSDGHNEVFVSPELNSGVRILDVLAHELVHTITGKEAGHKGLFKKIALEIGLEGKMTATVAGPGFALWAESFINRVGGYPAGSLSKTERTKQTTRMGKCTCPQCEYSCRTTRKWIEKAGPPICPQDHISMAVEEKEGPEGDNHGRRA